MLVAEWAMREMRRAAHLDMAPSWTAGRGLADLPPASAGRLPCAGRVACAGLSSSGRGSDGNAVVREGGGPTGVAGFSISNTTDAPSTSITTETSVQRSAEASVGRVLSVGRVHVALLPRALLPCGITAIERALLPCGITAIERAVERADTSLGARRSAGER
jgi:hypothetical protein